MTYRERFLAVLNYQAYDRLPVIHWGFWKETLAKWCAEGHLTAVEAQVDYLNASPAQQRALCQKLGFDSGYGGQFFWHYGLLPSFDTLLLEEFPDGRRKIRNGVGVTEIVYTDGSSHISQHVDHLLKDRASWEEHYKPRLQAAGRVNCEALQAWFAERTDANVPTFLFAGGLAHWLRDWLGVDGLAYLGVDDEPLLREIIDHLGQLCYETTRHCLELAAANGFSFDVASMYEDMCAKSGPLVDPKLFYQYCGPNYRRITTLLRDHGVGLTFMDCDGHIDALMPTWLENGVNTMWPMEVGTWNASLAPWRETFGHELRGVGGVPQRVFSRDKAAIDAEIERLKPLVALGGYIPAPDHLLDPFAKWELVQYYTERMRATF